MVALPASHPRYARAQELPGGAQHRVYLARDLLLEVPVVIKIAGAEGRAALLREHAVLSRLRHPNIVQAHDLFAHEGALWLVQSYAPGRDFAAWAAADPALPRVCCGAAALLRALEHVHARGAVHRDVKPANVRVGDGCIGALPALRLVDFGLASFAPPAEVAGTRGFIPPEVLAGRPATPPADLYALAATLLCGLTGRAPGAPLATDELWSLAASLPSRSLAEVVLDLLAPEPADRPTHRDLLAALSQAAGRDLRLGLDELRGDYLPHPPLVEREAALARLEQAAAAALGGTRRLIQIVGPGAHALCAAGEAIGRRAGLRSLVVDGAEALLRASDSAEDDAAPSQLATRIVDRLLAQRAEGLLVAFAAPELDALCTAVLHQLVRLGDDRPPACGWLLLRPGALPAPAGERWERLQLPPLTPAGTATVVRDMLHQREEIPWLETAHAITSGEPRALVELVRAQIEAGLPAQLCTPPQLDQALAARLAALPRLARVALQAAALAPGPLPPRVLARATGAALEELAGLEAAGLLRVEHRGVAVASELLRDRLRDELEPAARPALHGRLARAWAEASEPCAASLGHHLLHAGEAAASAPWLLQARLVPEADLVAAVDALPAGDAQRLALLARLARRARRAVEQPRRALHLAQQVARQDPQRGALLRAEILLDAGQPERALRALARADGTAAAAQIHLLRGRGHALRGDFASASAEAQRGLAARPAPEEAVQLQNVVGLSAVYLGQPAQGLELLRSAERTARAQQDPELLARVLNSIGIALLRLGRVADAARAHRECLQLSAQLGDLRLAAACALNLGAAAHRAMALDEALAEYRRAASLGRRGALATSAAWAAASEANLLLLFGEVAQAEARIAAAEELGGEAGRSLSGHLLLYKAEALRGRERLDAALQLVAAARERFEPADRPGHEAALLLEAELQLQRGELAAAQGAATALLDGMSSGDPDRWRAELLAARVALAERPQRLAAAGEHLRLALEREQPAGSSDRHWELQLSRARWHEARGERGLAAAAWAAAAEALAALRRRIPPQHRQAFDARPEIRALRAAGQARAGHGPTVAGLLRLLEINREINRALHEGRPPAQILDHILDGAIELTNAQRGLILLEEQDGLRVVCSRNLETDAGRATVEQYSRTVAQQALQERRSVAVTDAPEDARFRAGHSISGLQLQAVLCVPLHLQAQRGALYVDSRVAAAVFDAGTVALAEAFADQAGIVLESARLLATTIGQREELAQAKDELEEANRKLCLVVAEQREELDAIAVRLQHSEEELVRRYNEAALVGRSPAMRALFSQIERVAGSDLPVFISGESGTGKELVARALHRNGPAREQPFVAINCGAIPSSLLESELFGYTRGAFTGALRDRPGVLDAAGAGTLLLDEIGDMNREMQVKLLRVLQEGTYRRLGEDRERHSRCRVLSASHKRLEQLVAAGSFREDLFYRLNVVELRVPPLRQRREDIPLLVQHCLSSDAAGRAAGPQIAISAAAMRALAAYDWPGNVRQLENEIRRAALLCDGSIELAHLSPAIRGAEQPAATASASLRQAVQDYERRLIEEALHRNGFNVSAAASSLQLHRVLLHRKMRILGISRERLAGAGARPTPSEGETP